MAAPPRVLYAAGLAVLGAALIIAGLWLIYVPAALIAAGVALVIPATTLINVDGGE